MLQNKAMLVVSILLCLFSGASTAEPCDFGPPIMCSGTLDAGLFDFDSVEHPLGNDLDGTYGVFFDIGGFDGILYPEAFAEIYTANDVVGFVYAGESLSNLDLNSDGLMSSAFTFNASPDVDYFASATVGSFNTPITYDLRVSLVPEMETWLMMLAGLGFLGWRLRKKGSNKNGEPHG